MPAFDPKEPQTILDRGYIRLVESWGGGDAGLLEAGIIEAARQSTQGNFRGWEDRICEVCNGDKEYNTHCGGPEGDSWTPCDSCERKGYHPGDKRLLAYLFNGKPQHATPFEFAGMTLEIQLPIFVIREWHRHRSQCLAGDTMIDCVTPRGTTYRKSIRSIFQLKYGGVVDRMPALHRNGYSKIGTPVMRPARRRYETRTRILPNCQNRLLRVLDESSGDFVSMPMCDVWESGEKDLYTLETLSGRTIRTSDQHPFYTDRGWVNMRDVRIGDYVARVSKVSCADRLIPPALRSGIGVWTSMMRKRLIRDTDQCYLCGETFLRPYLILDHVIPVYQSLITALDERNLKPACIACSRQKTNAEQPNRTGKTKRGIHWDRVVSGPRIVGREMTYDISVSGPETCHNYIANNLVVHNSYNEMSARYAPLPDLNYMPTVERCLISGGKNKQAGAVNV